MSKQRILPVRIDVGKTVTASDFSDMLASRLPHASLIQEDGTNYAVFAAKLIRNK